MTRTWRGFAGALRANLLVRMQYRANLAIWAFTGVLQVVVYMSVWRAVADASGGSASGFTAAEFAGYFCAFLVVREATYSFIAWHMSSYVQDGSIATMLARPQHPVLVLVSEMTSYRMLSMLLIVPIAGVLFVAFDATVHTTPLAVVAALALLPLGAGVRMLTDSLLGLTSVKFIRISGILAAYYAIVTFFSGQFAPLAALPDWMQQIARALPFWWVTGLPAELLIGRADPSEALTGAAVLGAWLVVSWVALQVAWPRAMRIAETVGG